MMTILLLILRAENNAECVFSYFDYLMECAKKSREFGIWFLQKSCEKDWIEVRA